MPDRIDLFTEEDYAKLEARGKCWNCGGSLLGAFTLRGACEYGPARELVVLCDDCYTQGARPVGP